MLSDQLRSGQTGPAIAEMRPPSGRLRRVFAVVVIGPPGSGKTSVLTALHDALAHSDVAHAVIEVEAIAWAHPPIGDPQSFRHLESMCRMHEAAGCQLIVVSATATSADYLTAVVAAVAADDYLVVRLEADPRTLRGRIIAREPAEWSGLPRLLDALDEIALASRSLEDVHLVCSTEDASPLAVAAQIRSALGPRWGGYDGRSGSRL
jgi:energy-coupling factor transporter ATP-binding protein EcfA2